jgi:anti-sigma regulatory factor (Ser/Thr protein kinase)
VEELMPPVRIPVDHASRVAEVRREAAAMGRSEGLTEPELADLAIVATEAATNLARHAKDGEVHITTLSPMGRAGIEMLCIDRGPGMSNADLCRTDGYSTGGTSGTGMGAMSRLSDEFDIYSQPDRGTLLVTRRYARGQPPNGSSIDGWQLGSVCVPHRGETACGDAWAVRGSGDILTILLADGLGHGMLAADAANMAKAVFLRATQLKPAELLDDLHRALRGTRGAAVAIARIEPAQHSVRFAGLGNIAGVIAGGPKPQNMVSHNGTVGHEARRFQEFEYRFPAGSVLIMHSDGINTSWNLDGYPGLLRRHTSLVAAVLYRDANRGRDDVCVVVGRRKEL